MKTNNALKRFRLERSSTDQSAIDIWSGHQNIDILRFNRATIQYSYLTGNVFLKHPFQKSSDKSMYFLGLLFGGCFAGANGPDRLIGNDQLTAVMQLDTGNCMGGKGDPVAATGEKDEARRVAFMLAAIVAYRRDKEQAARASSASTGGATEDPWKQYGRREQMRGGLR